MTTRELLLRIEGEYREMPGLSLTLPQAQRLWGLDSNTCAFALTTLVERKVLKQTAGGTFIFVGLPAGYAAMTQRWQEPLKVKGEP